MSRSTRGWLPDACYRQQAFIPSDGGKMFYMSVGVIGAWANVRCTGDVCQYKYLKKCSVYVAFMVIRRI